MTSVKSIYAVASVRGGVTMWASPMFLLRVDIFLGQDLWYNRQLPKTANELNQEMNEEVITSIIHAKEPNKSSRATKTFL